MNYFSQIQCLKNKFRNKDCVIVSAGPSLTENTKDQILNFAKDKVVICVKQSIEYLDGNADILVLNPFNFSRNSLEHSKPFTIFVADSNPRYSVPFFKADLIAHVAKNYNQSSLAESLSFDDYLLDTSVERPFGPGILYEFVIYLPILFESKNVFFFGWDIGSASTDKIVRFYEKGNLYSAISSVLLSTSPYIYNKFVLRFENSIRRFFYRLGFNIRLNIPQVVRNESSFISSSTSFLHDWFLSHGCQPFCISTKSLLSEKFKRICLSK